MMKNKMSTVTVNLSERSYPIYIGEGILSEIGRLVKGLGLGSKILLVTNPKVKALYGHQILQSLSQAGFDVCTVEIPDGEEHKSLDSARLLYDAAFEHGLDRKCPVMALGGGVIGDLAGFVAATYMRGVPFIQVPTTLLAQVDSSVGGKVAVNHPKGKNIIGAFYQPKMVLADIQTLRSLPVREFNAGMAEVIKYGVIWDRDFFEFLENEHAAISELKTEQLMRIVKTSCQVKASVVEEDETEQGVRAFLNYGHTFGHAYEALTGYKKYVHGEAVAAGMVAAAATAVELSMLGADEKTRIENLVRLFSLPVDIGNLAPADIIASMQHDKKAVAGQVRFVLPEVLGKVTMVAGVSNDILVKVLLEQQSGRDFL